MKALLAIFCCCLTLASFAEVRAENTVDSASNKRLQGLSEELRCLVCQNQNLADSNAELAKDLKREIRSMIADGKSDREIIDFMVSRYGDFVLYKPPLQATTLLLWGGPALFLLIGLVTLIRQLRRRTIEMPIEPALDAKEEQRSAALLKTKS